MGKRYEAAFAKVDRDAMYGLSEGVALVKETAQANFDETIELAAKLRVDPRHADQVVRGAVVLPNGTGRDVSVLVFAKGDHAKQAEAAGADFVGSDELVEKIEDGWLDFDVAVATPDMMSTVGRLGRILGPRGLMPNPKSGTVTFDIEEAVSQIKAGKVEYRCDRYGIVHLPVGKASFSEDGLAENIRTVLAELLLQRPAAITRSRYFQSVTISAAMGPGIKLNPTQFLD